MHATTIRNLGGLFKKRVFYKLIYENCQLLILEMIWYHVSLQYIKKKK